MDQLRLSFRSSGDKEPKPPTSFDSFSNVVAYDTEFSSTPGTILINKDEADFEQEMKTLIKEAYSETTHPVKVGHSAQQNMTSTKEKPQDSSGMATYNKITELPSESQEFLAGDRPTPAGACSDEDVKTDQNGDSSDVSKNDFTQKPRQATHNPVHNISVGVHSKISSRKNQVTIRKTPFIEGDMDKHPSLIRVKSPEILREQKHPPKPTEQKSSSEFAAIAATPNTNNTSTDVRRSSSDSVLSDPPPGKAMNDEVYTDSGVYSPNVAETLSDTLPTRPLHSSTPVARRDGIVRVTHAGRTRIDLTSAEGRSRSSSEVDQNVPAPSVAGGESMPSDIAKIMRERAHLEGQVEMITREANAALEEKARLHSLVITLQSELAANRGSSSSEVNEEKIETTFHLQTRLAELEETVEERAVRANELTSELESAESRNKQLLEKINAIQEELSGRDASVGRLKSRIEHLQAEVQASFTVKTQLEAEIKSMKEDHEALVSAKNWYQEQLQFAQEARVQLQNELTVLQSKTVQQATLIEQLRVQNTQASHDLNYSHQMALQEKEQLARHLEVIEADMVQREAGFERIRLEQKQAEEKLEQKIREVDDEKKHLSGVVSKISQLETELEQKKQHLKSKQTVIDDLEKCVADLNGKLQEVQLSSVSKTHEIELLQTKYSETNSHLSQHVLQSSNKEEHIKQLKKDKEYLEIALRDAVTKKKKVPTATLR